MKKYAFSRSLIAISLLALFSSGASAAEKMTLKLAHNLERSHVVHQAFEEMAKEVNQLSDGNMKIRIYPSSQMGSARETMELLQNGALDLTKGSASDLESFDNIYAIYNLPFLFNDQNHFNKVVFGEVGKEIMDSTKRERILCPFRLCRRNPKFLCQKAHHQTGRFKRTEDPRAGQPDNLKND